LKLTFYYTDCERRAKNEVPLIN